MFDYHRPKPDLECPACGASLLEWQGKNGLPARSEIYATCRCSTRLIAAGVTEHGIWTRTELLNPTNAMAYPQESEREFRKRLDAFAKHPGHEG